LPLRYYLERTFAKHLVHYYHQTEKDNTLVLTAEMQSKLMLHTVLSTLLSSVGEKDTSVFATEILS
jgi:hypothetical protein